jgi:hypothetical protein
MSLQTTFRSVAKPRVKVLTSALAGGQLPLDQATTFIFSGSSVGTITSLLGHEYLIDGQELVLVNAHPTNSLTVNIGSYSKVIPAGYTSNVTFDEANASFYPHKKHADLEPIEVEIAVNAVDISAESIARADEDLTLVKLDGSRPLTGSLDLAGNYLVNVPEGVSADHAVNKSQLDTIIAALEASISASATALQWRSKTNYITKFTSGSIPANGDALVDSNFGAGDNRLFEDDAALTQATVSNIEVDSTVVFLKDGQEPKKMIVRNVLGTKRWYDHTEVNANLKLDRQVAAGDTFIVEYDLLDTEDYRETQALYHIQAGTPKVAVKIADLDWDLATGISIAPGYFVGSGDQTITQGDSLQQAISKLDGNIEKNKTDSGTALSDAIAQEVSDRDSAISSAIAQEVLDRDAAITSSQSSQDATLASVSVNEGASLIGIHDADLLYTATTVEGALREIRQLVDTSAVDIVSLETDVANHTTQLGQHTADIAEVVSDLAQLESDLASNSSGLGASKIGIHDANGDFTATTVEGALAELDAKVDNLNLVNLYRGLHEVASTGATTLNLSTNFVDQLVGGVVQDLSGATYMNSFVNRDGAMLIGGIGFTISGSTITFTAAGGGELVEGEVVEIRIIDIS